MYGSLVKSSGKCALRLELESKVGWLTHLSISTEYTGIACFTVRHKDEQGRWVENGNPKSN